MLFQPSADFSLFKNRRKRLLDIVKAAFPDIIKGAIVIIGGFEGERQGFRQDSSFYYLTGITEPAAVLCMFLDGRDHLYLPNFGNEREKWVKVGLSLTSDPSLFQIDQIGALGDLILGHSYSSRFKHEGYKNLLNDFNLLLDPDSCFFGELSSHADGMDQNLFFSYFETHVPMIAKSKRDIGYLVHGLRRIKDEDEIDLLYKAVQITIAAQQHAAQAIKPGILEYQVQAGIEYVFSFVGGCKPSFPSIVATGKNTTILHYTERNAVIKDGDLVVVDIGAEYGYYAADLTRTYPANGTFTPRQREIYQAVLDTQEYVASIAKPGMYLRNAQEKENSLHWQAVNFLQQRGFAEYFPHGVGHYLGLDVHDVGDYKTPLQPGDVFTIEPGIYIAAESLGVRIEDDYLMTDQGALCLSEDLPKSIDEIEAMMRVVA